MQTLKKVLKVFPIRAKINIAILIIAIIIGAQFETAALSVITPFITILMDSSVIETNNILSFFYNLFPFPDHRAFLGAMALLLAFIYIFKSVYVFTVSKIQYRFLSKRQIEMSDKLLRKVLNKPYIYHVNKNLAELKQIITNDVGSFIGLVTTVLHAATDFFMCFFIILFLLIQSPYMTLIVMGLALLCVFIYFKIFRKKVKQTGLINRKESIAMQKAIMQALGGIKELKLLGREKYFSMQFKKHGDLFVIANQKFQVYNTIPKLLIEAICFSSAFILIAILIFMGNDLSNAIPLLSLFVLAAFRLFPAVARFTGYANQIIHKMPSINSVYRSLYELDKYDDSNILCEDSKETISEISSDIIIDNISFKYPNIDNPVLENVSLRIPDKKSVAFIGSTGAGKTTLADIILGIYTPQSGGVYYNGKSIHHNFKEWVKNVAYIPQAIYLLDETILENVAYGIERENIDEKRVWDSLELAQIADFVRTLPDGIETVVGERGIRLSGGQRQRIGIARALYINPSILVLDEATSSLDYDTEKAVMEAIENFQGEKTMIIIAHRLSTIENCDIIYRVENGKVLQEADS